MQLPGSDTRLSSRYTPSWSKCARAPAPFSWRPTRTAFTACSYASGSAAGEATVRLMPVENVRRTGRCSAKIDEASFTIACTGPAAHSAGSSPSAPTTATTSCAKLATAAPLSC